MFAEQCSIVFPLRIIEVTPAILFSFSLCFLTFGFTVNLCRTKHMRRGHFEEERGREKKGENFKVHEMSAERALRNSKTDLEIKESERASVKM